MVGRSGRHALRLAVPNLRKVAKHFKTLKKMSKDLKDFESSLH